METQRLEVRVGTAFDGVVIVAKGRQFPDATDSWDGNWLITPIRLAVGQFRAELPATLRIDELVAFREGLEAILRDLTGEAVLESMEHWLTLTVRCTRLGALAVSGSARDEPGSGNRLQFEIVGMDQTFLPGTIDQLKAIERAFPSRPRMQ